MARAYLTWDSVDDWDQFTAATNPGEASFDHVMSPSVPYLGGEGQFEDAWTGGSGSIDVYGEVALTPGRRFCVTGAIRLEEMAWSGSLPQTRRGPLFARARDDAAGALGLAIELRVTLAADGSTRLDLRDSVSGSASANWIDLRGMADAWLIVRMDAESTGDAAPYTVTARAMVWEARGSRERYLGSLEVPSPSGAIYDFSALGVGWRDLSKPGDSYCIHIDALAPATDEAASMPPPRRGGAPAGDVVVRMRRWDPASASWETAWQLDGRSVREIEVSFLGHGIEQSARIVAQDVGAVDAGRAVDLIDEVGRRAGPGLRIDVLAPAVHAVDPHGGAPTDLPTIWSGVLSARSIRYDSASKTIVLEAYGWTAELERVAVEGSYWTEGSILDDVLIDAHAQIADAWPGYIALAPDDAGSSRYSAAIPSAIRASAASASDVLEQIAALGSYLFGVAVAGYPVDHDDEFRLLFLQSRTELQQDRPAGSASGSLGDFVFATVDLDDPGVTLFERDASDDDVPTRWTIVGASMLLHARSTPSIDPSGRTVRDLDIYDVQEYSGASFPGWEGAELQFVGVEFDPKDAATLAKYPAGVVFGVDDVLQDSFEVVDAVRNSAAYVDLTVDRDIPAAASGDGRLVYEMSGGTIRSRSTVSDVSAEESGRSRSVVLDDQQVRGVYHAAIRAHRELWAAARNARSARLIVRGWRHPPGHQQRNRIAVVDGTTRVTRWGELSTGGDAWGYLDDERPLGTAARYEIRELIMRHSDGGWQAQFALGTSPEELSGRLREGE